MRLQMRGIDHDPVGLSCFARQLGKDAVEHTQAALADKAVIDRFVGAVIFGRIAPHQPMLDDVNDTRHDPPVIDPWNAMGQREKRLGPAHLRHAQQERNIHHQRRLDDAIESTNLTKCKQFNRS